MGQRVNPIGLRIGISRGWDSIWWNSKKLKDWVAEDEMIRRYIFKRFRKAEISHVMIERNLNFLKVIISSGKPAFLIGQKGKEIDSLEKDIIKLSKAPDLKLNLKIEEIQKINSFAQLVANNLALKIEKNFPYKRTMKKLMKDSLKEGVKGIKIKVSGRLGGAEMAREEWYSEGRVPTQTLRSDIDYAVDTAHTKYGTIGVKVWLFRGDVIDRKGFFNQFYAKLLEDKDSVLQARAGKKENPRTKTGKKWT